MADATLNRTPVVPGSRFLSPHDSRAWLFAYFSSFIFGKFVDDYVARVGLGSRVTKYNMYVYVERLEGDRD
jgi:hypothetical protein